MRNQPESACLFSGMLKDNQSILPRRTLQAPWPKTMQRPRAMGSGRARNENPDVNIWLAAAWARHSKHKLAKGWIDEETGALAFCRVSQMGLLRLLTNPSTE